MYVCMCVFVFVYPIVDQINLFLVKLEDIILLFGNFIKAIWEIIPVFKDFFIYYILIIKFT